MNAMVEIRDLKVVRGKVPALQVAQLLIRRGEVLALVGPNGAGKSTLLLTLARLLKPKDGEILFNGQPVAQLSDTAYRRKIALVMQDPLLFDSSVFQNVAAGLRFRGVARADILRRVPLWLERLGVAQLADRRAGQLSGGEAQRVSLARALVLEPQLLLLDEPFAALDPPTRLRLLADLKALLVETNTTTVFVTHDLAEASLLASRVGVIIDNRLRQDGAVNDVFRAPADEDVAAFVNHMPLVPAVGVGFQDLQTKFE